MESVYYRREDYASFWRRMTVIAIDLVMGSALVFLLIAGLGIAIPSLDMANLVAGATVAVGLGYFVALKKSRFRTLGYRLCGVRIVGMDGRSPGWGWLIFRLAFVFLGPLNCVVDLTWLWIDFHRQAMRDKYANTYVVKAFAKPAGIGKVTLCYYDILGYNFQVREVRMPLSYAAGVRNV